MTIPSTYRTSQKPVYCNIVCLKFVMRLRRQPEQRFRHPQAATFNSLTNPRSWTIGFGWPPRPETWLNKVPAMAGVLLTPTLSGRPSKRKIQPIQRSAWCAAQLRRRKSRCCVHWSHERSMAGNRILVVNTMWVDLARTLLAIVVR